MTERLSRAASDYHSAMEGVSEARLRLRDAMRAAFADGVPKSAIHEVTGVSRPTIDKWLTDSSRR